MDRISPIKRPPGWRVAVPGIQRPSSGGEYGITRWSPFYGRVILRNAVANAESWLIPWLVKKVSHRALQAVAKCRMERRIKLGRREYELQLVLQGS